MIPGERYRFRVRAENIHGVSEPGDESQFVRIPKEGEMCLEEDEEGNCSINIFQDINCLFVNYFSIISR